MGDSPSENLHEDVDSEVYPSEDGKPVLFALTHLIYWCFLWRRMWISRSHCAIRLQSEVQARTEPEKRATRHPVQSSFKRLVARQCRRAGRTHTWQIHHVENQQVSFPPKISNIFMGRIVIVQGWRPREIGAEIQFGRICCEKKGVEFKWLTAVWPELAALARGACAGEDRADWHARPFEYAANVFSESRFVAARAAQPQLDRDGAGNAAPWGTRNHCLASASMLPDCWLYFDQSCYISYFKSYEHTPM